MWHQAFALCHRQTFFNGALHAHQSNAELVLRHLADAADAAVGEVVLVVKTVARLLLGEVEKVGGGGQHLRLSEHRLILFGALEVETELLGQEVEFGAELAVQLVAADTAEVVATGLEEGVAKVGAGRLDGRRLARTRPLVDLEQRLFLGWGDFAVLLPLPLEEVEVLDEPIEEARLVLLVVAEGAEQGEQRNTAFTGDPGAGGNVLARLLLDINLDPLTAVGMDRAGDELVLAEVAQAEPLTRLEDDARRANELGHDDTLSAVDDEGACIGHDRDFTKVDRLLNQVEKGLRPRLAVDLISDQLDSDRNGCSEG